MKRWLGPLATFALFSLAAHFVVLYAVPGMIMGKAMQRMADRGIPLHGFVLAARMTPQTQTVVRPSPDLAYALCRFDFGTGEGALAVRMAPYDGYSSLSFFDARTNNFARERGDADGAQVTLLPPGSEGGGPGEVVAPSERGLILIRRLAPSAEDYARVQRISAGDSCSPGR